MTKEEILDALKAVKYPPYSKDIVSFGMVKYVKIDGKKAEIKIFTGGAEDTAKKWYRILRMSCLKNFRIANSMCRCSRKIPPRSSPSTRRAPLRECRAQNLR